MDKVPVTKHVIWAFNGGRFDYIYLFPELIKKYNDCETLGEHTNLKCIKF